MKSSKVVNEKTVNLTLRLPEELREAFVETCKSKDTTASRELRDHIRKYIARHSQHKLL